LFSIAEVKMTAARKLESCRRGRMGGWRHLGFRGLVGRDGSI